MSAEQKRIAQLEGIVADALKAMDEGRVGDVRRILRTGRADALKPATGVLTKGQP